jgi:hypothetical protein
MVEMYGASCSPAGVGADPPIMRELRATRLIKSASAEPPMALNGTLLMTSAGVGDQIYF